MLLLVLTNIVLFAEKAHHNVDSGDPSLSHHGLDILQLH